MRWHHGLVVDSGERLTWNWLADCVPGVSIAVSNHYRRDVINDVFDRAGGDSHPSTIPASPAVHLTGTMLSLAGIIWYILVETRWFRLELDLGAGRAFLLAFWSFLKAGVYNAALGTVLLVLK
jgi:hypothetical protein